jgi:hypothetical protein
MSPADHIIADAKRSQSAMYAAGWQLPITTSRQYRAALQGSFRDYLRKYPAGVAEPLPHFSDRHCIPLDGVRELCRSDVND